MSHSVNDSVRQHLDHIHDSLADTFAEVRPRLRGWLHLGIAPLSLVGGAVLVALSPTAATRVGSALFGLSAVLLFAVSAMFHTGRWSPRTFFVLNRFDHANIFLLIAGSYTPFGLILLDGAERVVLLSVAWGGALLGVSFKLLWPSAPRWLSAPIYIAMGWIAVFFTPGFYRGALELGMGVGIATFVLIIIGGALYTIGGIVYGTKWPNPSPRWFGFHEVFHSLTILAFINHYVGVSLATYALR